MITYKKNNILKNKMQSLKIINNNDHTYNIFKLYNPGDFLKISMNENKKDLFSAMK
jgi:hypothetical protein